MADKPQEEFCGKGGSDEISGKENIRMCPGSDADHAFPGHKPGDS